jgi:hypothetical protein
MLLILRRSYDRKGFGLEARLQLSDEERNIVGQYNLSNHTLLLSQAAHVTVADVIRGWSYKFGGNLEHAMDWEGGLRSKCAELPDLISYCRSLGSDIVVELGS